MIESSALTELEDGHNMIRCVKCDYTSDKVTNCRRHFETMHTLLRKPEECCGISFPTKGDYREHRKVAHPGGLYFCHLCPAEPVKRKALLVRHMSIHTGIKQHTCKLCGYASPNKFNVKRHMITHSVSSSNSRHKDPKADKSSESQNQDSTNSNNNDNNALNILSAYHSGSGFVPLSTPSHSHSHSMVLPDSTTDSLSNSLQFATPTLRGILNSHENPEEKRKKSTSHSICDILGRDSKPKGRVENAEAAITSYYKDKGGELRFVESGTGTGTGTDTGNKEGSFEEVGEINGNLNMGMTCQNWTGIDESCTKGYCCNWSHVSAPGSTYTTATNLNANPYDFPLYYNNYYFNSLPQPNRVHTYNYNYNPSFSCFPSSSSYTDINNPARYLQHEENFFQPYNNVATATANYNITSKQYFPFPHLQQKSLERTEELKVCQEDDGSQAVLINQKDSRWVPALGAWTFKDRDSCLLPSSTFHYPRVSLSLTKEPCLTDGSRNQGGLPSNPPVAPTPNTNTMIYIDANANNNIYEQTTPSTCVNISPISKVTDSISQNSHDKALISTQSKFNDFNLTNVNTSSETDNCSATQYIPKKLRLSKKFGTNHN